MITFTSSAVAELRQKTGAGFIDCKKALVESGGDFEKAIDFLKKKGQKIFELHAGRESNEGVVYAITSPDHKSGAIVKVNCETDFVSKNSEFIDFAKQMAEIILKEGTNLDSSIFINLSSDLIMRIGEKIEISKYDYISADYIEAYNHSNFKIGVLVGLNKETKLGKEICMQIASMNPTSIDKESVPQDVIEREKNVFIDQVIAEGKPENMIERIVAGKMQKFFKESVLLDQQFIKDTDKTVADIIKSENLNIEKFIRISI